MNTIKQLFEHITNKWQQISFNLSIELVKLFKQALNRSPFILISLTKFLETIQASNLAIENYAMNIAMIYVIYNRYHNWFYIGISFTGSIWAKKHYTEKFSPNKNSMLLSEYHAAEIEEKGKNGGEEIIILPIIIFPVLFYLDAETKSIIENLMRNIEFSLISACKQAGYKLYNNPVALSPNVSKSENTPFIPTVEIVKEYCLEKVANLKYIPFPFDNSLAKAKKILFYDLWNKFERKVPCFFTIEIYNKWLITLEFWTDLEEK